MNNYLVLGGCGFIGKHLVEEILRNNSKANITIVDVNTDEEFKKNSNIKQIKSSLSNIESFENLLLGIDVIYHLISTTTPSDSTNQIQKDMEDTIIPTINLLEILSKYPEKKLIFVSSGGTVYGECEEMPIKESQKLNPICTYAVQKVLLEKYIQVYGHLYNINYTICRLSNPYGVGQNLKKKQGIIPIFVNKVINNEALQIWGDGEAIRDYIFINDAVSALFKLSEYKGGSAIFNIGSGEGYTINQIANLIVKELDVKNPSIEYLPERKCDVKRNILDISKIKTAIDWEPCVSIKEGILITIQTIVN